MFGRQIFLALLTASIWIGASAASDAQTLRYQPTRPTVSPYLNLFRDQSGVIPNYQSLVRPLQYQIEANNRQRQINAERGAALNALQVQLYDLERAEVASAAVQPTGKSSWFFQPSQRQRFMDASPYFSRAGSAVPRRN